MNTPLNKILYVDDDVFSRRLLEFFFEDSDVSLKTVATAAQLMNALDGFQPDLILMDAHLEETSGVELAARLHHHNYHVPTIFLTASKQQELFRSSVTPNVRGLIEKPFAPESLMSTIQELLHSPEAVEQKKQQAEDRLTALRLRYLNHLVSSLEEYRARLTEIPTASDAVLQTLKVDIHKVAGTSGLHGMEGLSHAAKSVEDVLIKRLEHHEAGVDIVTAYTQFLDELEAICANASTI